MVQYTILYSKFVLSLFFWTCLVLYFFTRFLIKSIITTMKKIRYLFSTQPHFQQSVDSQFSSVEYAHHDYQYDRLETTENKSFVYQITKGYLDTLHSINENLDISELKKLQSLTKPSTPEHNLNRDNCNYDLILYTDQIIGSFNSFKFVTLLDFQAV